jgi:hypothetical protein
MDKLLYCKGNLKSGYITTTCSPTLELTKGIHEIRIQTFLCDLTKAPQVSGIPVGIATNFVKGHEFSHTKRRFE